MRVMCSSWLATPWTFYFEKSLLRAWPSPSAMIAPGGTRGGKPGGKRGPEQPWPPSEQPGPKRPRKATSASAPSAASAAALPAASDNAGACAAFLAAHEITVHEEGAPPPCMRLDAAPFRPALVQRLCAQAGFTAPSAVQAASWPLAAAGRDVLAIAKTGSGKTLGFLCPRRPGAVKRP